MLINESPLIILPTLAQMIGLNESIVLQQIQYWLENNRKSGNNYYDNRYWTYNSYVEWQKQFPFWSLKTIQRLIQSLEEKELLISGNYNKMKIDRTKWYSINYEKLNILASSFGQNELSIWTNCPNQEVKMTKPIPKTTPETTTENTPNILADSDESAKNQKKSDVDNSLINRKTKILSDWMNYLNGIKVTTKEFMALRNIFKDKNTDVTQVIRTYSITKGTRELANFHSHKLEAGKFVKNWRSLFLLMQGNAYNQDYEAREEEYFQKFNDEQRKKYRELIQNLIEMKDRGDI